MKEKIKAIYILIGILIIALIGYFIYNKNNEETITNSNEIDGFTISGGTVSYIDNKVLISSAGEYTVSGELNGYIEIDTTGEVTLKLNNVTINNENGSAIYAKNSGKLTIESIDNTSNTLTDGTNYSDEELKGTVFSNDPIEITGNGTLNITGNYKHGIVSDDTITVTSGILNIKSTKDGLHANDNIDINGGVLTIDSGSDGMESEDTLNINGGEINLAVGDDGMSAAGNLVVNDGTINITGCEEGIESKNILTINNGNISILANDDGLNATNDITINNGNIYANSSKGDAIDSNGTLTINGGVIIALGSDVPEAAIDNDETGFTINGGIIVAAAGSNSPVLTTSKQVSFSLGSITSGSIINIVSNNTSVLTYKISKSYQSMIISTPNLELNSNYQVYTGGEVSGGSDFNGLYTNSTYGGGSLNKTFTTTSVFTNAGGSTSTQGPNTNQIKR